MSDRKIYCNFNLFDKYHRIYLISSGEAHAAIEEVGEADFDKLGEVIAFLCDKFDVNNVRLMGNEDYAKNIKQDIYTTLNFKEDNRKIVVEVN